MWENWKSRTQKSVEKTYKVSQVHLYQSCQCYNIIWTCQWLTKVYLSTSSSLAEFKLFEQLTSVSYDERKQIDFAKLEMGEWSVVLDLENNNLEFVPLNWLHADLIFFFLSVNREMVWTETSYFLRKKKNLWAKIILLVWEWREFGHI